MRGGRCPGSRSEHLGEFTVGHLGQCSPTGLKDGPNNVQQDDLIIIVILRDDWFLHRLQLLTKLGKTKVVSNWNHVHSINLLAQNDIFVPQPVEDDWKRSRAGVEEIIAYVYYYRFYCFYC